MEVTGYMLLLVEEDNDGLQLKSTKSQFGRHTALLLIPKRSNAVVWHQSLLYLS